MIASVHETAVVHPTASLAPDVRVGPYAVVGPNVHLAGGCSLAPHVVIEENTRLGERCSVGVGSVLGSAPQDQKYDGQETWLVVGDETEIREYSTLNRGTAERGTTTVGKRCYIMSYVHIAHDCVIGDHVVLANAVQLAGHVRVEDYANIGGLTPVHQFVRIGTHAFVGGGSRLPQDVPPYAKVAGNPMKLYGINSTGLVRAGFSSDVRLALKHAYRLLFNSHLTIGQAADVLRGDGALTPEVARLLDFVTQSRRGVLA